MDFPSKSVALKKLQAARRRSAPTPQFIELTDNPKFTEGDTIQIGKTRIRFHGIDAPEAKQERYLHGLVPRHFVQPLPVAD